MREAPWKPSKQQLNDALSKSVPDIIEKDLKVLFCGINPGLYTAAVGHHFARPGNRFWLTLYKSGFTPQLLSPFDERELLNYGFGITNIVDKTTASAADLTKDEIKAGGKLLLPKILKYSPKVLAVLGVGAFRDAFDCKSASIGRQKESIGSTLLWVLPNPSGINANYQIDDLVELFKELYEFINPK
jgi:double-stranded uracil-DNA glycosylase